MAGTFTNHEAPAQLYNTRHDKWTSLPSLNQRGYPWSVAWVLNGHTFYLAGSREDKGLVMYLSLARYLETGVEGLAEWGRLPPMDSTVLDRVEVIRLH